MDGQREPWSDDVVADRVEARLTTTAEALREHEIVAQQCQELGRRIDQMNQSLTSLWTAYAAERNDVERLEGITLSRVWATLRGARDDQLVQERAQAYAAQLRVEDAEKRLAALRREDRVARTRLHELAGAPAAYAAALDEKQQYLRACGDQRAPRALELAEARGRLAGELHELDEALQAASAAHQSLIAVQHHLGGASGWSSFDTWFGGIGSSVAKHERLDQAAAAAAHADMCLSILRTELADVGGAAPVVPQLAFGRLTRFLDVWLDNIFTDLAVGQRIRKAQSNVAECLEQVGQVGTRLERSASEVRTQLDAIETERHDLLTRDSP